MRLGILKVNRACVDEIIEALPTNAKVVDRSPHLFFGQDLVALKIACLDFPDVADGDVISEYQAALHLGEDGRVYFDRWVGLPGQAAESTWRDRPPLL